MLACFIISHFGSTQMMGQSLYFDELYEQIEEDPAASLTFVTDYYREMQELGTTDKQSEALYLLGYNYYKLSNLILARKYINDAIDKGGITSPLLSKVHTTLGIVYDLQNRYTDAIDHYLKALKLSELQGDKNEIARNLINLGLTYGKLNNREMAEKYLRRSLLISQTLQDTIKIGLFYQNMGIVFYGASQLDSAIYYINKAIKKFEVKDYRKGILQCQFNIALVYENRNQFDYALAVYDEILKSPDPQLDAVTKANALIMIGRIHVQRNQLELAQVYTDSAKQIIEEGGIYMLLEQLYVNQLYLARADVDSFKTKLAQLLVVKESEMQERFMEQIAEMQSIYELEQKDAELLYTQERLASSSKQRVFLFVIIFFLLTLVGIILKWNKSLRKYHKELFVKDRTIVSLKANPNDELSNVVQGDNLSPQEKIFKQIMDLINAQEHILNPELNLRDVAKKLGTNELYVSQAVNKLAGKNFSRFLNEFRVDEARNLLTNPDMENKTMEEIALLSGFSSVNTFYRQFKDQSGLTPTQYKNMHKENPGL